MTVSYRHLALVLGSAVALSACAETTALESRRTQEALLGSSAPEARIAYYRGRVNEDPSDVAALVGLGSEYTGQALWREAAGAYREALLLAPGNEAASIGYARAAVALGSPDTALQQIRPALADDRSLEALLVAGAALDATGRGTQARELYREALERDPRDLDARNNIALSMALRGMTEARAAMRSVAYAPDADPRHRRNLVLVHAILDEVSRARAYGQDLGLDPDEVARIVELGRRARREGAGAIGLAVLA